jgi:phospholipid/cholesterol/gamma-HCH transport system permease protein
VLALRGDWTVDTIAGLEAALRDVSRRLAPGAVVDVAELGRIDVAGAYLIDRTCARAPSAAASASPCAASTSMR